MSTPENEFEFGLLPVVINTLEQDGFVVIRRFYPKIPDSANSRYAALVMPENEHEVKLANHNIYSRWQWEQEIALEDEVVRSLYTFEEDQELSDKTIERDERYFRSATAWGAIMGSIENARILGREQRLNNFVRRRVCEGRHHSLPSSMLVLLPEAVNS